MGCEGNCQDHSGVLARVSNTEEDVKALFNKYDRVVFLLIGTLISSISGLVGVVFLLLKLAH